MPGDEMGNYTGTLPGPAINEATPGCLVKVPAGFYSFSRYPLEVEPPAMEIKYILSVS